MDWKRIREKAQEKIREVEVDGETIKVRKSKLGWKVVYPVWNDDGSFNWKHAITGKTWWNLTLIIGIVIIFVLAIYEYSMNMQVCEKAIEFYNLAHGGIQIQP